MNQLQRVFDYQDKPVRTILKDGQPWFVAKDICEFFGDTNYRRSLGRLDGDEKGVSPFDTPGGVQSMMVVNESGLYSLLFNMQPQNKSSMTEEQFNERVDALKSFKRWITHEVLPSIRKHGAYMTPEKLEEVLLSPETLIKLATTLKEEREARLRLEEKIKHDKPKTIFADAVSASHTSILVGDLAKLIKQNGYPIGQNRLFTYLRDRGFLIKSGDSRNMPTQRAMEMGLFEVKETTINNPDGSIRITKTPKVSGKGQIYFINHFMARENFITAV